MKSSIIKCLQAAFGSESAEVSDAMLMNRYVDSHDKSAFELLVHRHYGVVYRACRAVLRDHHTAEDASQAVFMILARKAASIRSRETVIAWLSQTAHRVSLRAAASNRREKTSAADPNAFPDHRDPSDRETELILHESIGRLTEKYRVPILLCYFEGLTRAEAAVRLGWPIGTLHARLERAKELLQESLTRRGIVVPVGGIAAFLASTDAPAVDDEKLLNIGRVAVSFMQGQISGIPSSTLKLVHGELRAMLFSKLKWILVLTVPLGLAGFALSEASTDRTPVSPITSSMPAVAASAPIAETKEIPRKTIEEYEALGAVYGGFVEASDLEDGSLTFESGSEAAKRGIPGFRWSHLTEKLPARLPEVTCDFGIEWSGTQFGEDSFASLTKQNHLKILIVSRGGVTDKGTAKLVEALAAPENLEVLSIGLEPEKAEDSLKHFSKLKNLQSFSVGFFGTNFSQVSVGAVQQLIKLENLRSLHFGSSHMPSFTIKHLAALKKLQNLSIVLIGDTKRELKEAFEDLSKFEKLQSLKFESLIDGGKGNGMEVVPLSRLADRIENFPSLRSLALNFTSDPEAKLLQDLKNLERLKLTMAQITAKGIEHLAALEKLKVVTIDFFGHEDRAASNQTIKTLATTMKSWKQLKTLKLNCLFGFMARPLTEGPAKVQDYVDGVEGIEELPFENLQTFHIEGMSNLTDDLAKKLSASKSLRRISLQCPEISGDQIKKLTENKTLEELSLRCNNVLSEDEVMRFAAMKNLKCLKLEHAEVGEKGLKALAAMTNLRSLELPSLELSDDKVKCLINMKELLSLALKSVELTDEGIAALTSLKSLEYISGSMTESTEKAVRKRMPRCFIVNTKQPDAGLFPMPPSDLENPVPPVP